MINYSIVPGTVDSLKLTLLYFLPDNKAYYESFVTEYTLHFYKIRMHGIVYT